MRCFCECHTYPGVYPPPCGVCGHDTREGQMVGGHRDGWEPNNDMDASNYRVKQRVVERIQAYQDGQNDADLIIPLLRAQLKTALEQVRIATDALEFIRSQQDKGEAHPSPGVIADDALIQMSVVE